MVGSATPDRADPEPLWQPGVREPATSISPLRRRAAEAARVTLPAHTAPRVAPRRLKQQAVPPLAISLPRPPRLAARAAPRMATDAALPGPEVTPMRPVARPRVIPEARRPLRPRPGA